MLKSLFAENIALIDSINVEFDASFNCLTGETGAGKSIIIGALNLALGERFRSEHIKYGKKKARVELLFDISKDTAVQRRLNELEIESDGELYVSRDFSSVGKSVCRLNGEIVTLAALKSISDLLVDVHGQHEHQSLLTSENHIGFLDSFAGNELNALKSEVKAAFESLDQLQRASRKGFMSEGERSRKIDMLSFQISEIEGAKLSTSEEDDLNRELDILSNAEKISTALNEAHSSLSRDMGASELVSVAMKSLSEISSYSNEYGELYSRLSEAYYVLEDATYSISDIKDNVTFDEQRLNEIEHRLDYIASLKKKYGSTVSATLSFLDDAKAQLASILDAEENRAILFKQIEVAKVKYHSAAARLSDARRAAAAEFSDSVVSELSQLGLSNSKFSVEFHDTQSRIDINGYDDVEFLLSTNKGEPLKPLSRVASGGEVSRIMLALKSIMAEKASVPTMVFDEIDTGISGRIAGIVGEKMKAIASTHQLIVITHLPQIAAKASAHFLVEKLGDDAVSTNLRRLTIDERYAEIARIMGGERSESAMAHAKELIDGKPLKAQQNN